MFPCLRGEQFWPLTASVGFFRAPPDKVAGAVVPWGRGSPWVRSEHDTFDDALRAHAPFGPVRTKLILSSARGSWATLLDTAYPTTDFAFHHAGRAYWELGCEFVATCWQPATPFSFAAAEFAHESASPRRLLRSRQRDLRFVQTSDQEDGWDFNTSGQPRPFEDPEYYKRRRKAERLPRELLARYAAAVGVAIDDPAWFDGPVVVVAKSKRTSDRSETPVDPQRMWHTAEELRRLCQYPMDKIPDDLVKFKSAR